jgi:holo-ACP synthase
MIATGAEASLAAILAARDNRVARRSAALESHPGGVAISVTPVMPGPVKDCILSRLIQAAALVEVDRIAGERGWDAELAYRETEITGPEALFIVAADPESVKRATVDLEQSHPLGRLWDIDVATAAGGLARRDLGLPPRACLVCGEPAHACARSRAHAVVDLIAAIETLVGAWVFMP